MIIKDATGMKMSESLDWLIRQTMEHFDIDRRNARRLLGETLVRTCVFEEIMATAETLIAKGGKNGTM